MNIKKDLADEAMFFQCGDRIINNQQYKGRGKQVYPSEREKG